MIRNLSKLVLRFKKVLMVWEGDLMEKYWEVVGNPQKNWKPCFKKSRNQILENYRDSNFVSPRNLCALFSVHVCKWLPIIHSHVFPFSNDQLPIVWGFWFFIPNSWKRESDSHSLGQVFTQTLAAMAGSAGLLTILLPCVEGQKLGGRAGQV